MAVRVLFENALIVADAFHLHRRVAYALTEVRREAWNTWRQRSKRLGRVFKSVRFALLRPRDELEADTSRRGERQRMVIFDATTLDRRPYQLKEAFRAAMAIGKSGDGPPSPPLWICSSPFVSARTSRPSSLSRRHLGNGARRS
jgi:hypothetical protein